MLSNLIIRIIVIALVIGAVVSIRTVAHRSTLAENNKLPNEALALELIQKWREKNNKPKYQVSPVLCEYASKRVIEIESDFSHKGFLDTSKKFVVENGFFEVSENIAKEFRSEQELLDGWLNSLPHRNNLEKMHSLTCLKCSDLFCVQLFATPEKPS